MIRILLILCIALFPVFSAADEAVLSPLQIIRSDQSVVTIDVELADTPAARGRGLMHRSFLAANHGMIFDFKTDQRVSMWMKNTPLALDMMFIDKQGKILKIHSNTISYSKNIIHSDNIVRAVLEVNAGFARRHQITVGDQIDYAIFPAN